MKNPHRHIVIMVIAALAMVSCEGDLLNDCLSGRGNPATEKRGLYRFGNIAVYDNINLTIEQGDDYTITINTGHKLIPMITSMINYNTLEIRNESPCALLKDPWKKVDVVVRLPLLDSLFVMSQGDVQTNGAIEGKNVFAEISESPGEISLHLNTGFFRVDFLKGTANIKISGHSDTVFIFHNAAGLVDGLNITSDASIVNSNSVNDVYIRTCKKLLDVKIGYIGNVYYRNDPERIVLTTSDRGRLLRLYQ
jgi:hypothetical protein